MHTHSHDHSHSPVAPGGRAFVAGIVLNTAFVVLQAAAGFWYGSMALLSDAGHNLSDVASLILSLVAFRLARLKPTPQFTYGYRKTTILAALANGVLLFITVGVLGYESVRRLVRPPEVEGGVVAIVAAAGVVVNFASAMFFFRSQHHDLNTRSAYLHLVADALVSLGVVVAGLLMKFTAWYWMDGVISIVILVVIFTSTWSLLTDSLRLSLDAVPPNVDAHKVEAAIKNARGVTGFHHLHVWAMSTTENALTVHVVLEDTLSFQQKAGVLRDIKHELMHVNIQHATIEMEVAGIDCTDQC